MKLDVTNMASLIAPVGCPEMQHDLFMVSAEYDSRLQEATGVFVSEVLSRVRSGPAQPHDLCDATLVRLYTSLINEQAQPQTPNELMFACYVMTQAIYQIRLYTNPPKIQVRVQPEPGFPRGGVFQDTNATA